MPGFSDDRFGQFAFGQWPWSRQVLWDFLPGLYRDQDAVNGGYLEKWTEGIRYSFDNLADRISKWRNLRDPRKVRTQYNETTTVRLGPISSPALPIEQRGVDGSVDGTRRFTSATARFSAQDTGKLLTLSNSAITINNRTFKIASIVNANTVFCEPHLVSDLSDQIRWEVRAEPDLPEGVMVLEVRGGDVSRVVPGWSLFDGFARFEVYERLQFFPVAGQTKALTVREGVQGLALADGRFQAEKPFAQVDVGKPITVSGSDFQLNNGKFQIYAVDAVTPTKVTLHRPLTVLGVNEDGGVVYRLRPGHTGVSVLHEAVGLGAPLTILVSGSSITVRLATDGAGSPTSTAQSVATAIAAYGLSAALVTASTTGTGLALAAPSDRQTIPGISLHHDSGPLVWALLPFPQLRIFTKSPPRGVVEQEGQDLSIGAPNTVVSREARFSSNDVGKSLVVRGSTLGQDATYTLASIQNATTATLVEGPLVSDSTLTWELRTLSGWGDFTEALVSAPSILQYLAQDFAIEVDEAETEQQQRAWVQHVSDWIDLKGSEKGYEIVAALTGFSIDVHALYRISLEVAAGVDPAHVFIIGDPTVGKHGVTGKIIVTAAGRLSLRTQAPSGFTNADIGSEIQLQNCSVVGNNRLFTIDTVVNAKQVLFSLSDTAVAPDYGLGGSDSNPKVQWSVVRLYTDLVPSRPLFDEVNVELMQEIVGQSHFVVDTMCSDPVLIDSFPVNIDSVAIATGVPDYLNIQVSGVTLPGPIFTSCAVIGDVGHWHIIDSAGLEFVVETIPVEIAAGPPPTSTFRIFTTEAPAVGSATLIYRCPVLETCGYCKAHRLLVELEEVEAA